MADSMIKTCNAVDKSSAGALWSALLKQPIRFDHSAADAYNNSAAASLPYMDMKLGPIVRDSNMTLLKTKSSP